MKEYVKPELFYEQFQLSQHVAACGWDMKNPTVEKNCTAEGDWDDFSNEGIMFMSDNGRCDIPFDDSIYCYQIGASTDEAVKVFNS